MSERKYTVSEIDQLRSAVRLRCIFGTSNSKHWLHAYYAHNSQDMDKRIEEQLRTYMIAGITADDIYKEDDPEYVSEPSSRN